MNSRKYPILSSPLKIGNVWLRNRMVSAPMTFPDIPDNSHLTAASSAFYELRAKGGAAAVTISECAIHPQTGKSHSIHIDLAAPGGLRSFSLAANAIRRHGAAASIELSHGGVYSSLDVLDKSQRPNLKRYGPSDIILSDGAVASEMPLDIIREITESYAQYAALAKLAGFNMIMLHAGHGWLLHQFLSPLFNFRTDGYGGSVEGRARFLLEVLDSIRKAVGPGFPIELRMSGADITPGGYGVDEAVRIAKLVEDKVQLLHVSVALHEGNFEIMHPSMFHERGCNVWLAAEVKKHVKVPVATIGALSDPEMMEEILASGKADVISLARALAADPFLPAKVNEGKAEAIVPCFRCYTCQAERLTSGLRRCSVNPVIGREEENRHIPLAPKPKKVLVAGGGPGGLMAALTAAERGHSVILCEKENELGGALRSERNVSFKKDLYDLPSKYAYLAREQGVEIRLGTEVTPELTATIKPDVLICAVGAEPVVPPIPGIDGANVIMASRLSDDGVIFGDSVAVLGGGLVGCEAGLHLAMQGKQVTVVEMLPTLAADANPRHRPVLLGQIERHGLKTLLSTRAVRITDEGVVCADESGSEALVKADTIICAVGTRPRRDVVDSLRDCAPVFMEVGDCTIPSTVVEATSRGYYAALDI